MCLGYVGNTILQKAAGITRRQNRVSNPQIDLLRIFGIFLIVYAHCTSHGMRIFGIAPVSSVYVIQLFIFCAGYFYRPEQDSAVPKTFLLSRAKAYLLPYFLWNAVYGILCNMLRAAGVIRYGSGLNLRSLFLEPWISAQQFMLNYPSWFLLSLFLVVLVTWGIRRGISRGKPLNAAADHVLLLVFLLLAVGAVAILQDGTEHQGLLVAVFRPLVLLPFYQLGYVYRTYWEQKGRNFLWIAGLLLAQTAVCLLGGSALQTKMVYGYFVGNPVLLVLTAVLMVLLLMRLASIPSGVLRGNAVLKYLSHCTMYIMLHHFFVMFLTQLVLWSVNHFSALPGFQPEAFQESVWYLYSPLGRPTRIVYVGICLVLPVVLHWIYERILLHFAANIRKRVPTA